MSDTLDLGALQNLLERVRGLKIACVGDLMLDRYVYGEVSRISPEAPIPVLRAARTVAMPGGWAMWRAISRPWAAPRGWAPLSETTLQGAS